MSMKWLLREHLKDGIDLAMDCWYIGFSLQQQTLVDWPQCKFFFGALLQLIHLFRQNQSKYSLDEQIVCKNTFILMYDILFQQC